MMMMMMMAIDGEMKRCIHVRYLMHVHMRQPGLEHFAH